MAPSANRHQIHRDLAAAIGEDSAAGLMALLPADPAEIARRADVRELGAAMRAEMSGSRAEMSDLRADTKQEIAHLRAETKQGIAALRIEISDLRGETKHDLAMLRGEVRELGGHVAALSSRLDAQLSKLVAANVTTLAAATALFATIAR